ncbi:MAG: hypothetical protein JSR76_05460 [Verrucomicrobia bacterium]|nr:hypothetical protein [Verrucomicrobiota bacterium]
MIQPLLPLDLPAIGPTVLDLLLEVEPLFECPSDAKESFKAYLESIKWLIYRVIPKDLLLFGKSIESLDERDKIEAFYKQLEEAIPISHATETKGQVPCTLSFATLCQANYTHGVGRFLADIYSRWLVPGKQLTLVYMHSLAFAFTLKPDHGYYLHELFVTIDNKKDLSILEAHLSNVQKEIQLNILAVQYARKIISLKSLTSEQKRIIIQENISSLLHRPQKEIEDSIFDHMHHLFIKVSAEEKISSIKEHISPLVELRPQIFERDIFHQLQNFAILFKDTFTVKRDSKHLTRMIAYGYLFRKVITNLILSEPHVRHLSIKLLHTNLLIGNEIKPVIGILITINFLRDNEIIGDKHLFKAIQSILPNAEKVPDSVIHDRHTQGQVRTIYMEVYKQQGLFTRQEIKNLKARLFNEIKTRIESVINPIFMPRNEEEVLRNILTLSNQLKYIQDIPQVIITFHKQTDSKLTFTIILLRILKGDYQPLQKLFTKHKAKVKFSDHEIRTVGLVRKKYPKEANIFEMHLEKKFFLRKDFSVDLSEARKAAFHTLTDMLGELRDYNGGMISKRLEVLGELKKLLLQINIRNDFLLENFFYSLSPNYMQSILAPHILKKVFLFLLEALENNYNTHIYFLKTQIVEGYFLLAIGAVNPSFKEFIEKKLELFEFEPSSLTSSFVNMQDISCLSFILKFSDSDQHQKFLQTIIEAVKIWKETVQKTLSKDIFSGLKLG